MFIFNSVEFYVIISVIAAAIVAVTAIPERKGEIITRFVPGQLLSTAGDLDTSTACIDFEVHQGNIVSLRRRGLQGVTMAGAVSLTVRQSGFDLVIEERITPGAWSPFGMADSVVFHLDFLAPEWYHIRYESETYDEHASLSLHVREGIRTSKRLIR